MDMEHSWLVQRLEKPHGVADNPFSFGGGLKNGGLSNDAMGLLREIFSFDYMGAAEFEFGAVPKAFNKIARLASADELIASSFEIEYKDVAKSWNAPKDALVPAGSAVIYVLCNVEHRDEVESRIRYWAREPYAQLKEMTKLSQTLRPVNKWDTDVQGWLELDNGFMFFTDREMFDKTADLFGVEAHAK